MPRIFMTREFAPIGAERWEAEWVTIKPGRESKDEIDPDLDTVSNAEYFTTREAAIEAAKRILKREEDRLYWGVVQVRRQILDWMSEEDGVADWESVDSSENVDIESEVS